MAFNYANGTDDGNQAGNAIIFNDTTGSRTISKEGIANMLEAIYLNDSNIEDYVMVLNFLEKNHFYVLYIIFYLMILHL